MASGQNQAPNVDLFDAYFRRADLDRDGRISGAEAVAFFQGSGLSKQVLAQVTSSLSVIAYSYVCLCMIVYFFKFVVLVVNISFAILFVSLFIMMFRMSVYASDLRLVTVKMNLFSSPLEFPFYMNCQC